MRKHKKKILALTFASVIIAPMLAMNTFAYATPQEDKLNIKSNVRITAYDKTDDYISESVNYDDITQNLDNSNFNVNIIPYEKYADYVPEEITDEADELRENVSRGNKKPVLYKDISLLPYKYSVTFPMSDGYTNYYFNVNNDGEIFIAIGGLDSVGKDITVYLYEANNDDYISKWIGNPDKYSGLEYNDLATNKFYYFRITAKLDNEVKGSVAVYHP